MNLKPYPEYKDSGVEWYGQIPENWKLTKLKHISKGIFDGDWVEFKDQVENGDYKLIQLKNIGVGKLIKKIDKEVTNSFYKKNNCMRIDDGNLLIARIPEPILRSTVFLEKFGNCITVVDVSILIPKNEIDSFFLSYLLNSDDMRQMGETLLAGATRQRISRSKISLLPVIIPPKIEQKEIINFLDKKTSEIDKTIQKDTKLIELLKEKRAALINHAVTKGLDPNAKMKDSGVEWIGEIPESANIMPFRRICNLNQGLQYPEDKRLSEPNETSKIYITIKYIHSNREIAEYIPNPPRRAVCKKKDVLLARTGATGEVITNEEGVFHNNFFRINYNDNIERDYLVYYLKMEVIREILLLKAGITTIPDLNHDDFLDTPIIVYPKNIQNEIVEYLNGENFKIDNTIQKIETKTKLLEEYKKSIIHHVVTGKVNVRGV